MVENEGFKVLWDFWKQLQDATFSVEAMSAAKIYTWNLDSFNRDEETPSRKSC